MSSNSLPPSFLQGLRIQDFKEICPWEILEGVKNSGPLMLSWFGAVRMKRKPLWFEEQRHLVRFHAHQKQFQNFISGPHTVKLPSEEQVVPVPVGPPNTVEADKTIDTTLNENPKQPGPTGTTPGVTGEAMDVNASTMAQPGPTAAAVGGSGHVSMGPPRPQEHHYHPQARPGMVRAQQQALYTRATPNDIMRERLKQINRLNQSGQPAHIGMPPPVYPGHIVPSGMSMPSYIQQVKRHQQIQAFQQHHQQQRKLQIIRMQQQMHAQQQMMNQQQYGSYQAPSAPNMHAAMRPMQATPPMQMQQAMQQQQVRQVYPGHSAMMGPPGGVPPGQQPGMQYPPQMGPVIPRY